jgi:hypothetical protein
MFFHGVWKRRMRKRERERERKEGEKMDKNGSVWRIEK